MSALVGLHQLMMFIRVPTPRMEEVFDILGSHGVKTQQITTLPYTDGESSQVLFVFSCSRSTQTALAATLNENGIGLYGSGSDVSVIPLAIAKDTRKIEEQTEKKNADEATTVENTSAKKKENKFLATIKARIAVENVGFRIVINSLKLTP